MRWPRAGRGRARRRGPDGAGQVLVLAGDAELGDPGRSRAGVGDRADVVTVMVTVRAAGRLAVARASIQAVEATGPTRVTRTQHGCHEGAGDPRPLSPPRKRHGLPDRQPSDHRTRLPGPHRPRKLRGPPGGHTGMHARLGGPRQAWIRPGTGTGTPSSGYPHRSLAPIPVRYVSVDPALRGYTAHQGDTPRDRAETARLAENSQLAGRLRRWWQVLGSNQRRLSRRFYSTLLLPESPPLTSG